MSSHERRWDRPWSAGSRRGKWGEPIIRIVSLPMVPGSKLAQSDEPTNPEPNQVLKDEERIPEEQQLRLEG